MTSPSDVLALARAVKGSYERRTPNGCECWHCQSPLGLSRKNDTHIGDCPVPIAQRVIEEEEK